MSMSARAHLLDLIHSRMRTAAANFVGMGFHCIQFREQSSIYRELLIVCQRRLREHHPISR